MLHITKYSGKSEFKADFQSLASFWSGRSGKCPDAVCERSGDQGTSKPGVNYSHLLVHLTPGRTYSRLCGGSILGSK